MAKYQVETSMFSISDKVESNIYLMNSGRNKVLKKQAKLVKP